jgi:hypothetical protein
LPNRCLRRHGSWTRAKKTRGAAGRSSGALFTRAINRRRHVVELTAPAMGGRRQAERARGRSGHLLKKASLDLSTPPSHYHAGLTEGFTCGRPALWWSTESHGLHEKGRTALLEMPVSNLLPCHTSCHQRRIARKTKTQSCQAWLMELNDRLRHGGILSANHTTTPTSTTV